MKYVGIYWSLFAPMIKKSIRQRFSASLAEQSIREGKKEYVCFDESRHRDGSYYFFTRYPICEFCEREGIAELMPALCSTDEVMFRLQHGRLYREHTIANGESVCDYWVVGDKIRDSK